MRTIPRTFWVRETNSQTCWEYMGLMVEESVYGMIELRSTVLYIGCLAEGANKVIEISHEMLIVMGKEACIKAWYGSSSASTIT